MTGFPLPSLTQRNYQLNLKYIYNEKSIFYNFSINIIHFLLQQKTTNHGNRQHNTHKTVFPAFQRP